MIVIECALFFRIYNGKTMKPEENRKDIRCNENSNLIFIRNVSDPFSDQSSPYKRISFEFAFVQSFSRYVFFIPSPMAQTIQDILNDPSVKTLGDAKEKLLSRFKEESLTNQIYQCAKEISEDEINNLQANYESKSVKSIVLSQTSMCSYCKQKLIETNNSKKERFLLFGCGHMVHECCSKDRRCPMPNCHNDCVIDESIELCTYNVDPSESKYVFRLYRLCECA